MKTINNYLPGALLLLFTLTSFSFLDREENHNPEAVKLTLIYGLPDDPEAFESYYNTTHAQLSSKMKGVSRMELTKFESSPDGSPIEFYRMAELYFPSMEALQETLNSVEGKAAFADLDNFATGGISAIIGTPGDFKFEE